MTIGHAYSLLAALPEREGVTAPAWVIPLELTRVSSTTTANQVAVAQVAAWLAHPAGPGAEALVVVVSDTAYNCPAFLSPVGTHPQLVTITRVRSDRTFYRSLGGAATGGRAKWYGDGMKLNDPATQPAPDQMETTSWTTRQGRVFTVRLEAWQDQLMSGHKDLPMYQRPGTLVRVTVLDPTTNQPVFHRPLWLNVSGARRGELTLGDIWEAYNQRYDLEHFFRFGKQRLLLIAHQALNLPSEEHWAHIVLLAAVQLWLARKAVTQVARPWERYQLRPMPLGGATPTQTQRGFAGLLRQIGTPAEEPKTRGKSPGRTAGTQQPARPKCPVVKKGARKVRQV